MLRALAPLFLLALAMAALVIVVPPAGEFPIDDDWLYARTVQGLVERGRLEVPAWSAVSLVLQAYWGGFFARLFGFSHTALRASTLVLAAAAVLGTYLLLRDLLDSRRAVLGALLLLVNPLFVFLAYSFMSEIPFLGLAVWALFCWVRALRDSGGGKAAPRLGWLAAGAALAGGAYLVRQIGVALPLAMLTALVLSGGRGALRRPVHLIAVLGPFLPAVVLAAYFDQQRGPVRFDPFAWMLSFWAQNGPGMAGVVLARLAGTCSTLGLFTLPVSIGILFDRRALSLGRCWRRLAGALLLTLLVGFVLRVAAFDLRPLFPHVRNVLTPRGFLVFSYNDTLPESILVPDSVLLVVTGAAMLGAALLALAVVATPSRETIRGPASVPLLFGLIALGISVVYQEFFDRYLTAILPAALLVALLAFGQARRSHWLALTGVALLAAWSIWWERDYLDRRGALWQAGLALVEQGIPPTQIDGTFEWNGWYQGLAVIQAGVQQGKADGTGKRLEKFVLSSLRGDMHAARWTVAYTPPSSSGGRVLAVIPYGRGQQVFALQRF
jgi:4-amino-4-deoxy-L-arabinose transferase-like glycosyltransferase